MPKVGPNSSSGGKAIQSWEAAGQACFVEPAAVPHAASRLHPFDAAAASVPLTLSGCNIS